MRVGRLTGRSGLEWPYPADDGTGPVGSLTGGLADRLRRRGGRAVVTPARDGQPVDTLSFAVTVERAAAGLSRRGVCPGDVVGVLAPVSPERHTAIYTVMAVGGIALPLELTSDLETLIEVLTRTDVRLLLVTVPLAGIALELADRSRVRQIIAFGDAPDTTPFGELLLPSPDGSGYDPARGLFDNGILAYQGTADNVLTTLHSHTDLLGTFRRLSADLALTAEDTVAVDPHMPEPLRSALVAVALWNGASVVTTTRESEADIRADLKPFDVTVQGSPVPARV